MYLRGFLCPNLGYCFLLSGQWDKERCQIKSKYLKPFKGVFNVVNFWALSLYVSFLFTYFIFNFYLTSSIFRHYLFISAAENPSLTEASGPHRQFDNGPIEACLKSGRKKPAPEIVQGFFHYSTTKKNRCKNKNTRCSCQHT
jgi:hypothetical protein